MSLEKYKKDITIIISTRNLFMEMGEKDV